MKKINVTKSYLPPIEEYVKKISPIWDNYILTNYGQLNNELVDIMEKITGIEKLHYVTNGTIAIQIALDALGITEGEIITTPFTFIASASCIVWQRCKPVFVDVDVNNFNIDASKIEEKITKNTKAILAVHCFGYSCDVEKIDKIAKENNLFVIYDAAHAFGTKIGDRSVLSYGDISTCSLHSTKVFHTIEGGLCVVNNKAYDEKLNSIKNFGTKDGVYEYIGINAKNSEFHAAMGLCIADHFEEILTQRKHVYEIYKKNLNNKIIIPDMPQNFTYNYIYFPVLFKNEKELLKIFEALNKNNIFPRRYFYPSLNTLKVFKTTDICPIAEDIAKRVACLPFDTYLTDEDVEIICDIIIENMKM